jgi:UDP-N-acetyl-D-mannosaminuronate dehydrogenase
MENNNKIGILGYGEVGSAMAKFYNNPKIKDLDRDDGLMGVEVLHVCLPWLDNFVEIIKKEIEEIKPKLIIIHTTTPPGITKKIADLTGALVVHSPIRGMHPDLHPSIKTFVKYIGTDNEEAGRLAREHLESLGMKTKVFQPSATTELGKLLSTSYYGVCIAWHGEMKRMCDELGIDFDKAVTDFTKTYNEGYTKLGKKNVMRPVLYPPKGGIGGHCITPNAEILEGCKPGKFIEIILKYKPENNNKE